MSTTPYEHYRHPRYPLHLPLIGIFNSHAMAEHAIENLRDAGFSEDEILYSGPAIKGHFLGKLISEMEGERSASPGKIAQALVDRGIPEDVAIYYAREYDRGHPLVVVQSPGREREARAVLRDNGGRPYDRSE
jgi:hypothetical protein